MTERDEPERGRSDQLEGRIGSDSLGKAGSERDMLADVVADPFDSVGTEHEPELESPEPTPQRDVPIAIVDDLPGG